MTARWSDPHRLPGLPPGAQAWQNRADGAMVLARWALGASLVSLVAVALQILAAVGRAMNGCIP